MGARKTPKWAGTTPLFLRLRAQKGFRGRSSPLVISEGTHNAQPCNLDSQNANRTKTRIASPSAARPGAEELDRQRDRSGYGARILGAIRIVWLQGGNFRGTVLRQQGLQPRGSQVSVLRCAIYARYSTDKQNPLSIDDQVRKCREFGQRQGWDVLDGHIYTDEAITGASDERTGLQRLIEAATSNAHAFGAVLVDDTSRLSRKLADSLRIFEQLRFADVRLIFVSQGIDTDSEQAEVLLATHGIVDSLYIKELAKKTHRGVEGRALQGFHTGGRCFGYRSVPIEDPTRRDAYGRPQIIGVKLEIEPDQAAIVRRIFSDYAAGDSIKTIAKRLNAERIPPPSPYRGQRHPSWAPSAISVMLRNDRYRGVVVWNRTRKVRDPKTGRRVQRERPKSEWVVLKAPHLRIVSDEVWSAVERRLAVVKAFFAAGSSPGLCCRSFSAEYLLSGFLKCGVCASKMVVVSGRGQSGRARYGCPMKHARGICTNDLHIRQDRLEKEVIGGLQRQVLREDVAAYALAEFKRQYKAKLEGGAGHISARCNRNAKS